MKTARPQTAMLFPLFLGLALLVACPAMAEGGGSRGGGGKNETKDKNADLKGMGIKDLLALGRQLQASGTKLMRQSRSLHADGKQEKANEIDAQSKQKFLEANRVYFFVIERFPGDKIVPHVRLTTALNCVRAKMFKEALKTFQVLIDNKKNDPELRAQSLYWSGICKEKQSLEAKEQAARNALMQGALKIYNQIRFDFPKSKWAKYARGRLASKDFQQFVAPRP